MKIQITRKQEQELAQYALQHMLGELLARRKPAASHANGHHPEAAAASVARTMTKTWQAAKKAKKAAAGGQSTRSSVKERRQASARFLARFSTSEARPGSGPQARGLGALVRRGYLKASGDGYVRTAKPYVP